MWWNRGSIDLFSKSTFLTMRLGGPWARASLQLHVNVIFQWSVLPGALEKEDTSHMGAYQQEGIFSVTIWFPQQRAHILFSNSSCGILDACPLF